MNNNNWIELNLPFFHIECFRPPRVPNLDKKAREHFGKLPDDMIKFGNERKFFIKYDELRYKLECLGFKKDQIDEEMSKSKDVDVLKVLSYLKFREEYHKWWCEQPRIINWRKRQEAAIKEYNEKIKKMSFVGLGLNKPGVLIEVEDNRKLAQYLIGHIIFDYEEPELFSSSAIVKRYKIVWSGDKE
jgi:hypothetical protein